MRNSLLGTAAVIAGLVSAPAFAAEGVKLGLGGFMEQWVGYADNDNPTNTSITDFDQKSDTEVHFSGEAKLDNGITVSALIELESDAPNGRGGASIDDSYLQVATENYGRLQLGSATAMTDQIRHSAPEVGIENQNGDYATWVAAPAAIADYGTSFWNIGNGNQVNYFTPEMWGLTLGATYIADTTGVGQGQPRSSAGQPTAYGFSASYDRQVGDFAVGADVAWGHRLSATGVNEQRAIQSNLKMSFAGVTVGGGYLRLLEDSSAGVQNFTVQSGHVFEAGASYETGPYAVSLNWYRSELQAAVNTPGDDQVDSVMMSGAYALGPGVDLKGSLVYVDFDDETGLAVNENTGWAVVGGMVLGF